MEEQQTTVLGRTGPVESGWLRELRSRSSGNSFAESPLAKLWAEADGPSVCDEIARIREAHEQEASELEPEDEPLTRDT
jgi:hypothetical protein